MGKQKWLFLLFILLSSHQTFGHNILWLAGLTSPSHQIWMKVLQKALASRGHNITALSVDVDDDPVPNLTFIHLENVYEYFGTASNNYSKMLNAHPFSSIISLAEYRAGGCVPALESEGFKTLMSYPSNFKFDLIVHDFVAVHCLLGFVPRFGSPPLISLSASTCPVAIAGASGNPQYPAYYPANHLHVGFQMEHSSRIYNTLLYLYDNLVRHLMMMSNQNGRAKEYFKNEQLDVEVISKSSVLTLVNLPPYDVLQPLFQTVIPIGGLQIQNPKPLSDKLNDFISGAKKGVVYFALGTNIKPETLTVLKIHSFLKAFKSFPNYRFLWKFDPSQMKLDIPKNVMLEKWLPQNDILAHPKTKLFIGHGGALSCHEAVWYGVPQIIIPFMIDQRHNAARARERGIALTLDFEDLNYMSIVETLTQVLKNPRKNVEVYSRIFHDQPQSPLDRAVFWVEYVLRNGHNATILRSPGQDMSFYYRATPEIFVAVCVIFIGITFKNIVFPVKPL